MSFVFGIILSFNIMGHEPVLHHAAYSQNNYNFRLKVSKGAKPYERNQSKYRLRKVKKYYSRRQVSSWNGHFSAENFKTNSDQKKLIQLKKTLNQVMDSLPEEHVRQLSDLEIKNESHVSRGMANDHKMLIHTGTINSNKELAAIFIHEMGHVFDLGIEKGTPSSGNSVFRDGKKFIYKDDPSLDFYRLSWVNTETKKVDVNRDDFVSGYAMADPFEDFAEHYIFYRLHGEKFRLLAEKSVILQQKYNFMRYRVFNGRSFQNSQSLSSFDDSVVWDATLLDYDIRKDLLSKN